MAEERTHNWKSDEIALLIEWRTKNEKFFTGKKNTSKAGWEEFVQTSCLTMSGKQAGKKWNNLKDKYKELKDPPTGKGVDAGSVTAGTWKWYSDMDAALGGQHSVNAPLVVASNLTATSGGVVRLPTSAPVGVEAEAAEACKPQAKKPKRQSAEDMMDFLREQAEREEERHQEQVKKQEEQERAAAARSDRFLSVFERMVDKL